MLKDITGHRFGKLLVTSRAGVNSSFSAMWMCMCDCGEIRRVAGAALRAGRNKSCGCSSPRFVATGPSPRFLHEKRARSIWSGMLYRCSDKARGSARKNYYDKGIRVCDEWMDFDRFFFDMGVPPDGLSIDRINGNKGYSKDNCRWATSKQQANNKAVNVFISHQGSNKTISQWAESLGVKPNTLLYRIQRGIPLERALTKSIGHIGSQQAAQRVRPCQWCEKPFLPRTAQIRSGTGKFCSHKCHGESAKSANQQRRAWAIRKMDELDALNITIKRLNEG